MKQMKQITVKCVYGIQTSFIGFYRRDMEKPNWHYYETEQGDILHFRKENMVAVEESNLNI